MKETKNEKSWDYQRGTYRQINIKFNMFHYYDSRILEYLDEQENVSSFIKGLILEKIEEVDHETV